MVLKLIQPLIDSVVQFLTVHVQPLLLPIVYNNLIPDFVLRFAMRSQIDNDIARFKLLGSDALIQQKLDFVKDLKSMGIAIEQKKANDQHYEVPDEFYQIVLGPYLKYSSGFWPTTSTTLAESEICMLELYCQRAELKDGMRIIDLGK
jgi:cyclopropane-fatty-acyl-phospholipid synthase